MRATTTTTTATATRARRAHRADATRRERATTIRATTIRARSRRATTSRTRGRTARARAATTNGDAQNVAFDAAAIGRWAARAREAPWDARGAGWREFFAAKPIGAVVEVDNARETISAKEVESHGLNWPTCRAEAVERARVNTVRFRQNYAQIACAATLLGSECAAFAMALVSFYAYLALRSDRILGELSLATKDALKWNDAVVAGVSRSKLKSTTLGVAVVLFLLSDATANTYAIMRSVAWTAAIALLHAILRPIDLKGTLADIVKDFRAAKSKEDLRGAARSGLKSMKAWISEKAKPVEATPIFVVEKGEKKRSDGADATPARRSEDANGAIDVDAREAEDTKYLP
jgi:hypothetical protein